MVTSYYTHVCWQRAHDIVTFASSAALFFASALLNIATCVVGAGVGRVGPLVVGLVVGLGVGAAVTAAGARAGRVAPLVQTDA